MSALRVPAAAVAAPRGAGAAAQATRACAAPRGAAAGRPAAAPALVAPAAPALAAAWAGAAAWRRRRRRRGHGAAAAGRAARPVGEEEAPPPDEGRRALAGSLLAAAALGGAGCARAADGVALMRQGMSAFIEGRVAESIDLFDASSKAGYPQDALWQRGLSLYYVDRFQEGAKQFRDDVAKNPNDTEESIWAMLCEARIVGFEQARKQMLTVGYDRRSVMRRVYKLYRGEDEAESLAFLQKEAESPNFLNGGSDQFYAALYLGLFAEARGDPAEARRWIDKAVATGYANGGDYMAALAKVHQRLRSAPSPA